MRAIRIVWSALVLAGVVSVSEAGELRIWTDENGTTMEAEYVRTQDGRAVLKRADGTEIRVSVDTLSERDQRYIILQSPPRLSISVSPKSNRSNTGYNRGVQVTDETISARATIKKGSSAPYSAKLTAELYMIGSRSGKEGCMILDKETSTFEFSAENNNSHTFESAAVNLQQVQFGSTKGIEYAGYVLAVRDKEGEVLEVKANKKEFSVHAAAILTGSKGTVFDEKYEVVRKSEKPDTRKGVKKDRKLFPGKRY